MRPNAARMQAAVAFVTEHAGGAGVSAAAVTAHLLEGLDEGKREKPSAYKGAASVVERVIRDRLVRQDGALRLHPWDERRRAYAEALERAAFAAPDAERFERTMSVAIAAWREAGDENRARVLGGLAFTRGLHAPESPSRA